MSSIANSEKLCDKVIKTVKEFKEAIRSERALAFFTASWCSPCKELIETYATTQEVKEFLTQNQIRALYIDVDEANGVANEVGIRAVPTIIAYSKGNKVNMQIGSLESAKFLGLVKEWYKL